MAEMSPYITSCLDVCQRFGTTAQRLKILRGWLSHRSDLRGIGFYQGLQWIDGSFVEDKIPNDLDVVTFFHPPPPYVAGGLTRQMFMTANATLFDRAALKKSHFVDTLWVDLTTKPESLVTQTRYWFGLFTHRRGDDLWKGMLEVPLDDPTEGNATNYVAAQIALQTGVGP